MEKGLEREVRMWRVRGGAGGSRGRGECIDDIACKWKVLVPRSDVEYWVML